MAKATKSRNAVVPANQTNKSVAKASGGVPAHLAGRVQKTKGQGLSKSQADNLVPLIYILQANSPQAVKKNPAYLAGAEAGCIWLRNSSDPIIGVDEGIYFQPCHFDKDVVEWIPRDDGGGFVTRHRFREDDSGIDDVAARLGAKRTEDPKNPNRIRYVLPNGHELVETRYHIGFVGRDFQTVGKDEEGQPIVKIKGQPLPFVIPLSSTGHTFSKGWMFHMNQVPGEAPSYARLYKLSTKFLQNNQGEWFGWDFSDIGWIDEEGFDRGEALYKAFEKGEKQIEEPQGEFSEGSASDRKSGRM